MPLLQNGIPPRYFLTSSTSSIRTYSSRSRRPHRLSLTAFQYARISYSQHLSYIGPTSHVLVASHGKISPPCRNFSNGRHARTRDIAVVGGGVTGMATAHFLSEAFPESNIALFDSKDILGGWIRSSKVDTGDGEVIFEQGPRSLRPQPPNGVLALRLIQELDLVSDLLVTPQSSPSAQNRFIYYPDHLVRMPGPSSSFIWNTFTSLWALFTEPVFKNAIQGLWHDSRTEPRPDHVEDESVGDFISRRLNPDPANNLVSALFHGIYAGDIFKLSAKQLMPALWAAEAKQGSLTGFLHESVSKKQSWGFCDDLDLHMKIQDAPWDPKLRQVIPGASVFTLKNGLGQLATAMEDSLSKKANVEIKTGTDISKIQRASNGDIKIAHNSKGEGSEQISRFSHVVSTIAPRGLISLLPEKDQPALHKTLASNPAVTVMVVNFYFRTPSILTKLSPPGGLPRTETKDIRGFGYLIPASVPFEQNPERALGVIFDSDISSDLWSSVPEGQEGTKLTVMLGGHWWDGWSEYPTEEEGAEMALDVLARHLGLVEEPAAVKATLQRDCIPQYYVGHASRMGQAHDALVESFHGRLRVAGSWYTGVGVNDCLRSAFDVVAGMVSDLPKQSSLGERSVLSKAIQSVAARNDRTITRGERTGLEGFKHGRPMALIRRAKPGEVDVVQVDPLAKEMGFFESMPTTGSARE